MVDDAEVPPGLSRPQDDTRILLELALLVHEGKPVAEVFTVFVREMVAIASFDFASLIMREDETSARLVSMYPADQVTGLHEVASLEEWGMVAAMPYRSGTQYPTQGSPVGRVRALYDGGLRQALTVPLFAGEDYLGLLTVGRLKPIPFSRDDRHFIVAAGRSLASAMRNELQLRKLANDTAREEGLNRLALVLNSVTPLPELFPEIRAILRDAVRFDFFAMFTKTIDPAWMTLDGCEPPLTPRLPTIVEARQMRIQRPEPGRLDVRQSAIKTGLSEGLDRLHNAGFNQQATVVLRDDDRELGRLLLARLDTKPFSDADERFLEMAAVVVSRAVAARLRMEEATREVIRERLLGELSLVVQSGAPPEQVFDRARTTFIEQLGFSYISAFAHQPASPLYRSVGAEPALRYETGILTSAEDAGVALLEQAPTPGAIQFRTSDVDHLAVRMMRERGIARGVALLLRHGTEIVGILTAGKEAPTKFSEADVRFLERMASLLSQSIDNEIQSHRVAIEAARSAVLNQLSLMVNAGQSVSDVFDSFQETLQTAIDFDWMAIFYRDSRSDRYVSRSTIHRETTEGSDELARQALAAFRKHSVFRYQVPVRDDVEFPGLGRLQELVMGRAMSAMMSRLEDPVGFIVVARKQNTKFDEAEMNLLELVAQLLGQSVSNYIQIERARAEAARGQLLNELSVLLNAGEPVETLFSRFETLLQQGVGLQWCGLLTRGVRGDAMQIMMSPDLGDAFPKDFTLASAGMQQTLSTGKSIVQFRTANSTFPGPKALAEAGMKRVVCSVMQQSGQTLGLLVAARVDETRFDDAEIQFLEVASALLGQAVANQHRIQRASEDVARSQLLTDLSILVNAGEPVAAVFDRFERMLRQGVSGLHWCALLFREGDDDRLIALESGNRSILGGRQTMKSAGVEIVRQAGGGVVQFSTSRDSPRARYLKTFGIARAANALMRRGDELYGMLMVGREKDEEFDSDEFQFIEVVAALIGQAVANQLQVRRARTEVARSQLLNEMAILLNAGGTVEAAFERMAGLMAEALPFDYISAVASDKPEGPFKIIGRYPEPLTEDTEIPYEETGIEGLKRLNRRVFQARSSSIIEQKRAQVMLSHGYRRIGITALTTGDQWLGTLLVGRKEDTPFSVLELQFLDVMSVLLAQALTNQGQILRARAEAARNQLLNQLAILLNAGEEVEVVFERLAGMMAFALPFDYLVVVADEAEEPSGFRVVGSYPPSMNKAATEIPFDANAIRALRASSSRFNQFRLTGLQTAGELARVAESAGLQRAGFVLMKEGDHDIGFLGMLRSADQRFTDEEARFLEVVGVLVGQAVANRSRLHRSEEDAAEQRMLAHAAGLAASATGTLDMIAGLTEAVAPLVPEIEVTIGYIDGNSVEFRSNRGSSHWQVTERIRAAVAAGQLAYSELDDVVAREWDARIHAFSITVAESSGVKPMLLIGSRDPSYRFTPRTLRLLRMLTNILGSSMVNIRQSESMAHERAQYELVLSSLSEAVLILNSEMVAEYVNPAGRPIVESLSGAWRTVDIDGRLSLTPPAAADALRKAMLARERGHGRAPLPIGGEQRWFDFEVTPFDAPDARILLVAEDVTMEVAQEEEAARQRERMEQASRLAALGELIGGVAHELNNPLTAILGFAEFLTASGTGAEDAEIIKKEALRARDIVRDLLFIARPGKVEQEPLYVADLVPHVDRLRRTSWASAGIKVTWRIAEQTGPVMGNEHQLTQVLLNLVTNAEHALQNVESPTIDVGVFIEGEDVVMTVRDNGEGMDEETRRRVFEPFFTTKQGHGTGLGLPLSYSIIAAHRGRIEIESERGVGTCFKVTLPLVSTGETRRESQEAPTAAPPVRALVIDDEPNLRKVCQRLITSLGSECSVAATGGEGLRMALETDYDLILCDYRLASDTAATVVDGLAKSAPARIERVVIATGATTDPGVVQLTEKYNLRLVAKPYGHAEIAALLAAAADASASRAAN